MVEHEQRGRMLLAIAHEAIAEAREPDTPAEWPEEWLRRAAATFVTLRIEGDLRGCIGTIDARRALGDDVAHNAHAAAYRDPRFPPLARGDRTAIAVEISVLSPRERIEAPSEDAAVARLRPGVDGVVVEYQDLRATFLPQVWESIPEPFEFLVELKRKAGLPARFWHDDLKLWRYSVDKYR
jgi:AmmeMemoRadiSam system protein A